MSKYGKPERQVLEYSPLDTTSNKYPQLLKAPCMEGDCELWDSGFNHCSIRSGRK
jgi:hypothetical protein